METFKVPQNVYLTGMPGCGKSTLGKALAASLNISFYDLDHSIEEQAGKDINLIFEEDGESGFRAIERRCLVALSEITNPKVVATGGGTPCFHDNMHYMNKMGVTVFLQVPLEIIVRRLSDQGTDERPLLRNKSSKELLGQLYEHFAQRKSYYLQARIHLEGSAITMEQIADALKIL
jgi:shikimate kinase